MQEVKVIISNNDITSEVMGFVNQLEKITAIHRVQISQEDSSEVTSFRTAIELTSFLKHEAANGKWVIYFSNDTHIRECGRLIYMPLSFYGDITQFESKSFTEAAKDKLIYNELSKYYMGAIANDTEKETTFLANIIDAHINDRTCKVLDCCCGVGRHDYALALQGYHVSGIDISTSQIATAHKLHSHPNVSYSVRDVRNYQLEDTDFSAVICMWTTYNYLSLTSDFLHFIENAYKHMEGDGILVLDSKNIPALDAMRTYSRSNCFQGAQIQLLIHKRVIGKIQNSQYFYFIEDGDNTHFYFDEEFVRFYTLEEIETIAKPYFETVAVYGDFEGNDYDANSMRFILVMRKR